jgi:hypothetical protein
MSIEQRIRENLKAAAGELIVPEQPEGTTVTAPRRRRSGVWFAAAGMAAALALAIPVLAGWFTSPEPEPSAGPTTAPTVNETAPPTTSPDPAQVTLGETTVGDYVIFLGVERVDGEKPPTATVTLEAMQVGAGEPSDEITVGAPGGFFWNTVTGPDSVCEFAAEPTRTGAQITVAVLLSPSIGCSDTYQFSLDAETGSLRPGADSAEAASALFVEAWVSDDQDLLEALALPEVVDQVNGLPAPVAPVLDSCEGAAGSLYCTYQGEAGQIIIRVSNLPPYQITEVRTDG